MASRVDVSEIQRFREELRALPEDIANEAGGIVLAHASDAAQGIRAAYPQGKTGNLRRGVTIQQKHSGRAGVSAIVRSRAKHASIFEKGTVQRHTKKGANRGAMPQPQESERMIPVVVRTRGRLMAALIDLVQRAGFTVQVGS